MTDTFSPLDQLKHQAEIIKSDLSRQQNALEEGEIVLQQSREKIEAMKARLQRYREVISRLEADEERTQMVGAVTAYTNPGTWLRVRTILANAGFGVLRADQTIKILHDEGIVFRELS